MNTSASVVVETVKGSDWFVQSRSLVVERLGNTFEQCVLVDGFSPEVIVTDVKVVVQAPDGIIVPTQKVWQQSDFIGFSAMFSCALHITTAGLYHYQVYCDGQLTVSTPYQIFAGDPADFRIAFEWEDSEDEEPLSVEEQDDIEAAQDIVSVLRAYRFADWTPLQLDDLSSKDHYWTLSHSDTACYVIAFDPASVNDLIVTEYNSSGTSRSHRGPGSDFQNAYLAYAPVMGMLPHTHAWKGLQVVWVNDRATGMTWLASRNHVERMGRLLPLFISLLVNRV